MLLTWSLFDVARRTRRFIDCSALFRPLSVANFSLGSVALLDPILGGLFLKGDLAHLIKVFFADFLLARNELGDVGVVTFFLVLMCALQNRVFGNGLNLK